MKANNLLEEIKTNIKDYNIDYLKNKVTDDRYKDPLTKSLAKYNSEAYDEIFQLEISEDFEISDKAIKNIKEDIDYYFSRYNPHDEENQNLMDDLMEFLGRENEGTPTVIIGDEVLVGYGDNMQDTYKNALESQKENDYDAIREYQSEQQQ